jgi:hypothetical protein
MFISNKRKHIFILSLLIIGIIGTVFFFPLPLGNHDTCFYHRLFSQTENHHPTESNTTNTSHIAAENMQHHDVLREYILPFGLFWWSSIGLTVLGAYFLNKQSKYHQNKEITEIEI